MSDNRDLRFPAPAPDSEQEDLAKSRLEADKPAPAVEADKGASQKSADKGAAHVENWSPEIEKSRPARK